MKVAVAVFIALIGGFSALAAVNPAPGTNAVPQITTNAVIAMKRNPWVSSFAAGLTLTRGNSDTELATAKFLTEKKQNQNEWSFDADAAYGESDSTLNADSLHGNAHYNYLFSDRFYAYGNADALHDGIQDLKYQVSLSPGIGYYFIRTKPTTFAAEIGPGFVTEERGDVGETYMSLRMAEHGERKLNDVARIWEKAELLPQINQWDNYIVNAEVGVESAITKKLSLQVTLDDSYVNEPAAGRVPNDVKLVSGVVYKF